jgi:hypothetical protein
MMEHLGGHIWDHANAISELALLRERFHPSFVSDINYSARVSDALNMFEKDKLMDYLKVFPDDEMFLDKRPDQFYKQMEANEKRMKEYLTSIAVRGFSVAPDSPYKDRVCEVISHNNVGGVVKKTGVVFGLPDDAWKGILLGFLLIISNQIFVI